MTYADDLHRAVVSYLEELDRWRNSNIPSDQLNAAEGMLRAVIWEPGHTIAPEWASPQGSIRRELPKLRDPWYRVAWRALVGQWFR